MSEKFFFTWDRQRSARGVEIAGGRGATFWTASGDEWLDLGSLSYQASLGHGNERMVEAICRQARSLCLAPPSAVFAAKRELADALLAVAPEGFGKVFFTLGGAEAVENAMKMARLTTGRHKFVSRYRSYHGATFGALSLTGDYRRPPLEPGLGGVARALRDADIPDIVAAEGNVAAVVLESVTGANGVDITPASEWQNIREACDRSGALLIVDEVLTGFGRTGRCFAFEHFGVVPDVITVAKALTGGYAPLGAVLVRSDIAERFEDDVLWAGLTNYGHPLGCAAGLEALAIYREEQLFERATELAPALLTPLEMLSARISENVLRPRGIGLLAAVDLVLDDAGWQRLTQGLDDRRLSLHVSQRRGTAILAPPLVIDPGELARGVAGFVDAVSEAADA